MNSNNNSINYTPINTALQKKNDNNIQYFFKHFKEYALTEELKNVQKEFGGTDGGIKEEKDNIISKSTQFPDLSKYKKGRTYYLLNKNKCFFEANKGEYNYFPRMHFFIGEENLILNMKKLVVTQKKVKKILRKKVVKVMNLKNNLRVMKKKMKNAMLMLLIILIKIIIMK